MNYNEEELNRVVDNIRLGEGFTYESLSGAIFKLRLRSSDDCRKVRLAWSINELLLPPKRQPEVFEEFYKQTGIDKNSIYNGLNGDLRKVKL